MEIELARQKLIREGHDFNTVDAFRFIDLKGLGEVDPYDFCKFLKMINSGIEIPDIVLFF